VPRRGLQSRSRANALGRAEALQFAILFGERFRPNRADGGTRPQTPRRSPLQAFGGNKEVTGPPPPAEAIASEVCSHAAQVASHSAQIPLHSAQVTLQSAQMTLQSAKVALQSAQMTLHFAQVALQSAQMTLHFAQVALQSAEKLRDVQRNSLSSKGLRRKRTHHDDDQSQRSTKATGNKTSQRPKGRSSFRTLPGEI
jgi:hypothetical protein